MPVNLVSSCSGIQRKVNSVTAAGYALCAHVKEKDREGVSGAADLFSENS